MTLFCCWQNYDIWKCGQRYIFQSRKCNRFFSKCGRYSSKYGRSLVKCGLFSKMRLFFQNATIFPKCGRFYQNAAVFRNAAVFTKMCTIKAIFYLDAKRLIQLQNWQRALLWFLGIHTYINRGLFIFKTKRHKNKRG